MKISSKIKLAVLLGITAVSLAGVQGRADEAIYYSVYCADNKIEVEMRNLEQMKTARGSNVCVMQKFTSASSAEDYAAKRGGKGASCSCQ